MNIRGDEPERMMRAIQCTQDNTVFALIMRKGFGMLLVHVKTRLHLAAI